MDFMGLTTFCNSRRCGWVRRPLYCVSVGYSCTRQDTRVFLLNTWVVSQFPKLSITQLQPRIYSRSPCQPFPRPESSSDWSRSLGFSLVLQTASLPRTHARNGNKLNTNLRLTTYSFLATSCRTSRMESNHRFLRVKQVS